MEVEVDGSLSRVVLLSNDVDNCKKAKVDSIHAVSIRDYVTHDLKCALPCVSSFQISERRYFLWCLFVDGVLNISTRVNSNTLPSEGQAVCVVRLPLA